MQPDESLDVIRHTARWFRADITTALIQRKGFNLVAVEADWPDAYRVSVGFYGLDLYSLHTSMESVLTYPTGI